MPESLVVSVMRQNKLALLAREQVQMQAMAQRQFDQGTGNNQGTNAATRQTNGFNNQQVNG